ncbi:ABC-2 transporter permease [Heyndrickxia faecalis]|uniref:ABC-2 transporter permease n=1 Tax=Heyndrickxia faecalis TaxID=2824910 RepID=A0AAU7WJ06_9BACI
MKGLILNNLYSIDKSVKFSLLISTAAIIPLIISGNPTALKIAVLLPFLIIPMNAFEVLKQDSMSSWNKFEITLPLKKSKIIQSKFITFLLLLFTSLLLTFALFYCASIFISPTVMDDFFNIGLRGMGLMFCAASLVYPLTYIFGIEKSDMITMGSMGFSFVMFFFISFLMKVFIGEMKGVEEIFSLSFLLVSIFLFILSYATSVIIYRKKEF